MVLCCDYPRTALDDATGVGVGDNLLIPLAIAQAGLGGALETSGMNDILAAASEMRNNSSTPAASIRKTDGGAAMPPNPNGDDEEKSNINQSRMISSGNLQRQVEQGRAPRSIDGVDPGRGPYEQDHVHLKDGRALNRDGTWKHGSGGLNRIERTWLQKNGWGVPTQ